MESKDIAVTDKRHVFSTVHSDLIVDAPIIALRRDTVVMPGGSEAFREVVEHFGAVAVVASRRGAEESEVLLVNQWRQSVGDYLWELPAGLLDLAGEDPLTCARRELAEEAGCEAAAWSLLADIVSSPGFCDEAVRIFLAADVAEIPRPQPADDEEADIRSAWVGVTKLRAMIDDGLIVNSIALTGLLRFLQVVDGGARPRPADEPFVLRPGRLAARRGGADGADLKRRGITVSAPTR